MGEVVVHLIKHIHDNVQGSWFPGPQLQGEIFMSGEAGLQLSL